MNFVMNRCDCCWDAVSSKTGRLYVIELHDQGYFAVGSNLYRTIFDAIRVCELADGEASESIVRTLESAGS